MLCGPRYIYLPRVGWWEEGRWWWTEVDIYIRKREIEMRESPTKFQTCKLDSIIISSGSTNNYLTTFLGGN